VLGEQAVSTFRVELAVLTSVRVAASPVKPTALTYNGRTLPVEIKRRCRIELSFG
jgi:hypothetical protein